MPENTDLTFFILNLPVGDYKLCEFRLIADSLKNISEKAPLKEILANWHEI
jgi:hypothetical protein